MEQQKWLMFVLAAVLTSGFILITAEASCTEVRQTFAVKKIGPLRIVPFTPHKARNLQVCSNDQPTCCNRRMERKYGEAVVQDFQERLESRFLSLEMRITTFARRFEGDVTNIIFDSRNDTFFKLAAGFSRVAENSQLYEITESFYDRLVLTKDEETIRDVINEVQQTIDRFFSSLFTLSFQRRISSSSLTKKQSLCVGMFASSHYHRIRQEMKRLLVQTIQHTSLFIRALQSAIDSASLSARSSLVTSECQNALIRMQYCSHCYGLTLIYPCPGLCTNVMRGCLVGMSEIDMFWKQFVSGMIVMKQKMEEEDTDAKAAFEKISLLIAKAARLKLSEDKIHEIKSLCKVRLRRRQQRSADARHHSHRSNRSFRRRKKRGRNRNRSHRNEPYSRLNPKNSVIPPHKLLKDIAIPLLDAGKMSREIENDEEEETIRIEEVILNVGETQDFKSSMNRFVEMMNSSIDLFGDLPDLICGDILLSDITHGVSCWDGTNMGKRYQKPIIEKGLENQFGNPEVTVRRVEPEVQRVVENLRITSKKLLLECGQLNIPTFLLQAPYFVDPSNELSNQSAVTELKEIVNVPCDDDEDNCEYGSGRGSGEENPWMSAEERNEIDPRVDRKDVTDTTAESTTASFISEPINNQFSSNSSIPTSTAESTHQEIAEAPAKSEAINREDNSLTNNNVNNPGEKKGGDNSAQGHLGSGLSWKIILCQLLFLWIYSTLMLA